MFFWVLIRVLSTLHWSLLPLNNCHSLELPAYALYCCFGHYIDPRLSECLHHINSSPAGENPSCLQTTAASCASQSRSQTVPHLLLKHISTLPSCSFVPLTSRTPNVKHGIGGCVGGGVWLVGWLVGWMVGCVVGLMASCVVSWIGNW